MNKQKQTGRRCILRLYAPAHESNAMSDWLKVKILTNQLIPAIEKAPDNVRHHLAAVSWWIIVGIAEQSECGARVKLRNAIERVYTDATRTDFEAFLYAEKAIDHFVIACRAAYRIILAAAPLRSFFHIDSWDEYELSECFAYCDTITNAKARDFLRSALKENEAENERIDKGEDDGGIQADARIGAHDRKRRAELIMQKKACGRGRPKKAAKKGGAA